MPTSTEEQIINLIEKSQRILLLPSSPPDGDSLGAALSFYLLLKKLGKESTVICADPIPETFKFLPTIESISRNFGGAEDFIVTLDCTTAEVDTIKYEVEHNKVNIIITPKKGKFGDKDVSFHYGESKYDLIITVDTGDLQQLGKVYEQNPEMFYSIPVINIDHHASNGEFGRINMVDITASSTTEILIPLFEQMEAKTSMKLIDADIATLLLAGIITDTGSFQHANTTPRAFGVAAHLLDLGARQQEIIKYIYRTKRLSTLKLWGKVLSKIKYDEAHHLVWSTITAEDLKETESSHDESGGIIDELLSNAPGAQVVLLIKEKDENLVSVSVRTPNKGANANDIAHIFGGGGHPKAAGFRVKGMGFYEAENFIINKIKEYQEGRTDVSGMAHMQPAEIVVPQQIVQEPKKMQTASDLRKDPLANIQFQKPEVVPAAREGGEDLLLKDFRKRKEEESKRENRIEDMTKQFFKPKSEMTVEDVLKSAPGEFFTVDDNEIS
ncbi:MAG: bifunctional oligoribonuclease/PAP phosphatase NrnA [Candidatus Gracilibacteria bacterium]